MNEIKISEIISYLFTKKLLIASSTFCVAIITIIISLSVKEIYRSEALVTITPDSLSVSPQPSSGLSTFASFAGINLESGTETKRTPSYVVAKITSKSFFKYLASFPSVIEGIMADKSFDPQNGKIIYDQKIYDPQSKQWKRSATGSRSSRPTYIEAYEIFMANLNVIADRKTGFITIVYDHSSPFFAKKIVDLIVSQVNDLQKEHDLSQSEKALEYLLKIQSTNTMVPLEKSLSSLIGSEMQKKMLANIKDNYLIEYIDEPIVAETRIYPRRSVLVVASTGFAFFIINFLLVFYNFVYKRQF